MKILLTILLFFVLKNVSGQSIDKIIQTTIETTADKKISEFRNTLDSVLVRKIVNAGTFNVDTIRLPAGNSCLYQISITGNYGAMMASGVKFLAVRNDNGIYTIRRMVDDLKFTGITGKTWETVVINNMVVVRITSTISNLVKWEYKRIAL